MYQLAAELCRVAQHPFCDTNGSLSSDELLIGILRRKFTGFVVETSLLPKILQRAGFPAHFLFSFPGVLFTADSRFITDTAKSLYSAGPSSPGCRTEGKDYHGLPLVDVDGRREGFYVRAESALGFLDHTVLAPGAGTSTCTT